MNLDALAHRRPRIVAQVSAIELRHAPRSGVEPACRRKRRNLGVLGPQVLAAQYQHERVSRSRAGGEIEHASPAGQAQSIREGNTAPGCQKQARHRIRHVLGAEQVHQRGNAAAPPFPESRRRVGVQRRERPARTSKRIVVLRRSVVERGMREQQHDGCRHDRPNARHGSEREVQLLLRQVRVRCARLPGRGPRWKWFRPGATSPGLPEAWFVLRWRGRGRGVA